MKQPIKKFKSSDRYADKQTVKNIALTGGLLLKPTVYQYIEIL
jgi:hypothetical protein